MFIALFWDYAIKSFDVYFQLWIKWLNAQADYVIFTEVITAFESKIDKNFN